MNTFEEWISVGNFGAVGDGRSDDTLAFTSALSDACRKGIPCYIPAGVYLLNRIDIPNNCTIIGAGSELTTLKLSPQNLDEQDRWAFLRMRGTRDHPARNIHLRNFSVDGSRYEHKGSRLGYHECITWDWGCDSSIINVNIRDAVYNGIQIDGAHGILICNCRINNCGGWGIHLSCNGEGKQRRTMGSFVINNYVTLCGHQNQRGGIDQNNSSEENLYWNNIVESCYKNFEISKNALSLGNKSAGEVVVADHLPRKSGRGIRSLGLIRTLKRFLRM